MKKTLLIIPVLFFFQILTAEIIVFKDCNSEDYNYEKNDYILDLEQELMTREFIYDKDMNPPIQEKNTCFVQILNHYVLLHTTFNSSTHVPAYCAQNLEYLENQARKREIAGIIGRAI